MGEPEGRLQKTKYGSAWLAYDPLGDNTGQH